MKITLNDKEEQLPDNIKTVADLLKHKNVKKDGTAVAVNDELSLACSWDHTDIKDGDKVTMISAAFGG